MLLVCIHVHAHKPSHIGSSTEEVTRYSGQHCSSIYCWCSLRLMAWVSVYFMSCVHVFHINFSHGPRSDEETLSMHWLQYFRSRFLGVSSQVGFIIITFISIIITTIIIAIISPHWGLVDGCSINIYFSFMQKRMKFCGFFFLHSQLSEESLHLHAFIKYYLVKWQSHSVRTTSILIFCKKKGVCVRCL